MNSQLDFGFGKSEGFVIVPSLKRAIVKSANWESNLYFLLTGREGKAKARDVRFWYGTRKDLLGLGYSLVTYNRDPISRAYIRVRAYIGRPKRVKPEPIEVEF